MIYAAPGATFEASAEGAPTGLVGTIGVQIIDTPGGPVVLARTTAGIAENPAGSGIYSVELVAPDDAGTYTVVWDTGGASPIYRSDTLEVTYDAPMPAGPVSFGRPYAYASAPDIARKLTFLPTITGSSRPNATQMAGAIDGAADEIDAALAGVAYTVPVPTTAPISLGVLREWNAIGAAGEVALSLPQGSDSKHASEYRERFTAILDGIRDRDRDLPDATRESRGDPRTPARALTGAGASPMFSRDSIDDR
jgi:hypothetical protein